MDLERNKNIETNKPKLLTEIRNKMRASSYSIKTINAYVYWVNNYIRFNNTKHPKILSVNCSKVEIPTYRDEFRICIISNFFSHF